MPYLRNWITTKTALGLTSHEHVTKTKPNLGRIPHFRQEVRVIIVAASKLLPKFKPAQWTGFHNESKGHKVYWPDKQSVSVERNLTFVPDSSPEVVWGGESTIFQSKWAPHLKIFDCHTLVFLHNICIVIVHWSIDQYSIWIDTW